MSYVPIVTPPTAAQPVSPRSRELAGLVTKVIDEYTKAHPATSGAEVRVALKLAQAATGKDNTAVAVGISLALGLGVLALTLGLFFFRSSGGEMEFRPIMPAIIMALIVLFGLVAVVVSRR
jgi:hypothetical protein